MLRYLRNFAFGIYILLSMGLPTYAQSSKQSVIEELILAIDSTCTILMAEPIKSEINESYASTYHEDINYSYFEITEDNNKVAIDRKTLIEILKNKPIKDSVKMFVQDSFKKIKVLTLEKIESLRKELLETNRQGVKPENYVIAYPPLFDNKKRYAIVDCGRGQHLSHFNWCKYLLKKENNKWIVIVGFDRFMN
jgi:hypothetical protein